MTNKSLKNLATIILLRYGIVISLLGIVIIFVLSWFLFLDNPYKKISTAGSLNVSDKQQELNEKKAELESLKILNRDFDQISQANFLRLKAVLPAENEIVEIYSEMARLATENEINLTGVKLTPQAAVLNEKKTSLQTATITINVAGIDNFSKMLNFLQAIEKNIHLLDLSTFNYSNNTNSYTLNFTTYYLTNI